MSATFTKISEGRHQAVFEQPFRLANGQSIQNLCLVYETMGKMNGDCSNVVLIHHSLSTSCHVASHPGNTDRGWWQGLVGVEKAIDSKQYFIICINNLGSCYGSTGPASLNPTTNQAYRADFPSITVEDIINAQKLLLDAMGIGQCYAVIGGSMGGMLSVAWGHYFPDHAQSIIAISTAHKSYPLQVAQRSAQREAIQLDPDYQQGHYQTNPTRGLKVARMVSHLFYRGLGEIDSRFNDSLVSSLELPQQGVVSYYHYNADKFVSQFDTNSYMLFLDVMDAFNMEQHGEKVFHKTKSRCLIIATDTDVLYPPRQQLALYELMKNAGCDIKLTHHHSPYGHDAFLIDAEPMGAYIREHLQSD